MNNLALISCSMAWKDWLHEASLSFCGVLALASMLAPLLILHGVHNGVIDRLRESLMRDPSILVVVPVAGKGAGFEEEFIAKMGSAPGLRFGIGRTRAVASELQLHGSQDKYMPVTVEATAPKDPLLLDYGVGQPLSAPGKLEMVLSHSVAQRLALTAGDTAVSRISRRLSTGKFDRLELKFLIKGVLPVMAGSRDTAFVDLDTLNAIQDFRDGIKSPLLQADGELEPPAKRHYESFRAYAAALDDVPALEAWFKEQGITVKTRARDIAAIKRIDSALASVIGLIAAAACAGFFAFMASTARAAARRKWKQMGMLKLIGFHNFSILIFPMTQAIITGALGCLLAFIIYGIVAYAIDYSFASETGGEAICTISAGFVALCFLCVEIMAILASLRPAIKAAAISPSTAIREN